MDFPPNLWEIWFVFIWEYAIEYIPCVTLEFNLPKIKSIQIGQL